MGRKIFTKNNVTSVFLLLIIIPYCILAGIILAIRWCIKIVERWDLPAKWHWIAVKEVQEEEHPLDSIGYTQPAN